MVVVVVVVVLVELSAGRSWRLGATENNDHLDKSNAIDEPHLSAIGNKARAPIHLHTRRDARGAFGRTNFAN